MMEILEKILSQNSFWGLPGCLLLILFAVQGLPAQSSTKYLQRLPQATGTLYFVNPLPFKGANSKADLETDFTFLSTENQDTVQVALNFSVLNKKEAIEIDWIKINNSMDHWENSKLLFLQKEKKHWHTRYTTSIKLSAFLNWFFSMENQATIRLKTADGEVLVFEMTKKGRKAVEVIRPILEAEVDF